MKPFTFTDRVLIFAILVAALFALAVERIPSQRSGRFFPEARADAGFDATYLVSTGGVISSTGTTPVRLLQIPGGNIVPSSHRFWCGGITLFNTDSVTRTPALISHYSHRVIWSCPLPAASGVILDNVNMLWSDQGTTQHPEGIDLILDGGAAGVVGAVGQGYVK